MKKFKFSIRGNNYEVEIKEFDEGIARIEVNGTPYKVEVKKETQVSKTPVLRRPSVATPKDAHIIKKTEGKLFPIKAPLPGNILQVFIKPGDKVRKDDRLVIYEAMKMENTLLSEKGGVVKTIKVNPGDSVLQEDILIELELD
jgi:biotin carboxyl carrier protein